MKKILKRLNILFFLLAFSVAGYSQEVDGLVIYVSDGDTFHLQVGGKERIKVRVADIDCPEITQPYGLEAKEFVISEIKDQMVHLNILSTDRYGRKIARVTYQGKDLSEELIKNGLAWHYKQYSDDKVLAGLEKGAIDNRKNIWSDKNPVAPWDYRRKTK